MKQFKYLIRKIVFLLNILRKRKEEPFFSLIILVQYLFYDKFYYGYKEEKTNLHFNTHKFDNFIVYDYDSRAFYFPNSLSVEKAKRNFLNVINEQTHYHPHRYSYDKLNPNWLVYDFGAAEGYQIHKFLKNGNKVVAFEPDHFFYECLLKTFKNEIAEKQIKVLNVGISKEEDKKTFFSSLQNIITLFKLDLPNYLKVDIEGEELTLVRGLNNLISSGTLKMIDIATYHRPQHMNQISEFLKPFSGEGYFSNGFIVLNIDTWNNPGNYAKIYHPIIRKVLYTKLFTHD